MAALSTYERGARLLVELDKAERKLLHDERRLVLRSPLCWGEPLRGRTGELVVTHVATVVHESTGTLHTLDLSGGMTLCGRVVVLSERGGAKFCTECGRVERRNYLSWAATGRR